MYLTLTLCQVTSVSFLSKFHCSVLLGFKQNKLEKPEKTPRKPETKTRKTEKKLEKPRIKQENQKQMSRQFSQQQPQQPRRLTSSNGGPAMKHNGNGHATPMASG